MCQKKRMKIKTLFFLLIFISCKTIVSQTKITGKILDANKNPLFGANILAFPENKGKLVYSVSADNGEYSLILTKTTNYNLSISFIGYITRKELLITPQKDSVFNYILHEDPNKLEEIIIKYKVPVQIKKDTTTYNVDAFINGKERKLKQILKKLPGVEVDRKGNVTVKGRKVTTLLVDSKKFFTGDTKLAVNNIPADVINQIEVIEDYHENPFMKGLDKSEEIAMNIKLKEDKKQFIFGDIEVGLGIKNRYVVHPALFKYSPNVNYSLIGDYNNTNRKSFTIRDYINFQGGLDLNNFSDVLSSPVIKLLRNQNFTESKHKFGGFNVQWSLNEKMSWSSFLIALSDKTNSKLENSRNYLINNIDEFLTENEENKQNLVLGKLQLLYVPEKDTRIKFENKFELTSVDQHIENFREINNNSTDFSTNNNVESYKFNSFLKVEKKFTSAHTSQAKATIKFAKTNDDNLWNSSENIYPNALSINNSNLYALAQNTLSDRFESAVSLKHFWIVNNRNHLYLNIGNEYVKQNFNGNLFQINDNATKNQFNDFTNYLNLNQYTIFTSLFYKKLIGDALVSFELKYQNYYRTTSQLNILDNYISNKILPKIDFDWDINNTKKLTFKYSLTNSFPNFNQLLLNNTLRDYNSIIRGNVNLEETFYHFFSLRYRRYKTYGWSYYPSISYRLKEKPIQNIFNPTNIFNTSNPININTPNKSFNTGLRVVYNYKYYNLSVATNYNNASYASIINGDEILSKDNSIDGSIKFRTVYENKPNVDFSYTKTYNNNSNLFFNNISDLQKLDLVIDYEKGNWMYKTEFFYNDYKNQTTGNNNSFNELNASIFYQQEDSAWGFEILGTNISNNSSKLNGGLSTILFSETRRYVFPRTFMLKVIYKL